MHHRTSRALCPDEFAITQNGADTVISFNDGGSLVLKNVDGVISPIGRPRHWGLARDLAWLAGLGRPGPRPIRRWRRERLAELRRLK